MISNYNGAVVIGKKDRARKPTRFAIDPYVHAVILEGWGHFQPEIWVEEETTDDNCTMLKARFPMFSDEWKVDFDLCFDAYLRDHPAVKVLTDFRSHDFYEGVDDLVIDDSDPFADLPEDVTPQTPPFRLPDEINDVKTFPEGAITRVTVNKYERSDEARALCIASYGTRCHYCHVDLAEVYGEVAQGLIHVHHITPISAQGQEYQLDPVQDLRPTCPNCHAVIHRQDPPYSERAMKLFLADASRQRENSRTK